VTTRQPALGSAALVACMVLWGTLIPATNFLLAWFDAVGVSVIRFALGVAALWLAVQLFDRASTPIPWRKSWALGLGISLFATCYTLGIANANPINAAVIASIGPLTTSILAWLLYRTPPAPGLGLAVVLAVGGSLVVSLGGKLGSDASWDFRGGEIMLLIGQAMWSWYSLASVRWLVGHSQLRISYSTMLPAMVYQALLWALLWALGWARGATPADLPEAALWVFLVIGPVVTAGGVYFWNFGASQLGAPVAALFLNLIPLVAIGISMVALGERVMTYQILGGVLVIAGVASMQIRMLSGANPKAAPANAG